MRLDADAVREGLHHPEPEVRAAALAYFAESDSPDPAVMPAAIEATRRFGWRKAFPRVDLLPRLRQTADTVEWAVETLRHPPPSTAGFDRPAGTLADILRAADAELLRDREAEILALRALDADERAAIRDHIAPDGRARGRVVAAARGRLPQARREHGVSVAQAA